jgi:hypothetical protein
MKKGTTCLSVFHKCMNSTIAGTDGAPLIAHMTLKLVRH